MEKEKGTKNDNRKTTRVKVNMATVLNHCVRRYLRTSAVNATKRVIEGPSAVSGGHEGKFVIHTSIPATLRSKNLQIM